MASKPEIEMDPELALAIRYASPSARDGLTALFALDDALAQILRTTTEPALGQMRLVWWRDALDALDHRPPPAMPVLEALSRAVVPHGVGGTELSRIAEGWAMLVEEEEFDAEALERYATARGRTLFIAAGKVAGADKADPVSEAGAGWALADLARNVRDLTLADAAARRAQELSRTATRVRWSRSGRALGALAHLTLRDAGADRGSPRRAGSPGRVARMLFHRITGR